MELMKKNKKVEQLKASALVQLPIETDINISDSKPDAKEVIYDRAAAKLEEVKAGTNKIWVKGKISYQILYATQKEKREMACMTGEIPFMEELYLDAVEPQDMVLCNVRLDNYAIKLINSRKWNFMAKLLLQPKVQVSMEETFCTDMSKSGDELPQNPLLECQKKSFAYLENVVSKKDLLRIHEEIRIPGNYGSADETDWKSVEIKNIIFQMFQEKIVAHGELQLFLSYTEDGNETRYHYDTAIPFSQTLVCHECQENMLADIAYHVIHEDVNIKENEDGNNALVTVEIALELEMKLWQKESAELISGVYGINCEAEAQTNQVHFMKLYKTDTVTDTISAKTAYEQPVAQIIHDSVRAETDTCEVLENAIHIKGNVYHNTFLQKQEETGAYGQQKATFPFDVVYQLPGADGSMFCKAVPVITDNKAVWKEDGNIEYMTEITFTLFVLETSEESSISDVSLSIIDQKKQDALPGIMVHVVQKGDTLWKLGKEYYMSIEMLKEVNGLTSEEIEPGEKLILMKMV